MKNCINILCVKPNEVMLDFCNQMYDYFQRKKLDYTIYITVDEGNNKDYKDTEKYKFIIVDHLEATKKGYKDSLLRYYHRKDKKIKSMALDKSLYYFSKHNEYDNYWLIEDDVFIPSVKTIPQLDKKYGIADLLVGGNGKNEDGNMEWHWPLMVRNNKSKGYKLKRKKAAVSKDYYLPLPWYNSFCQVVRISKEMLQVIENFVKKNKTLLFMEFMFNTLAMHHHLKIKTVEEFKLRYDDEPKDSAFKKKEIRIKNLYHYIKNPKIQKQYRLYTK